MFFLLFSILLPSSLNLLIQYFTNNHITTRNHVTTTIHITNVTVCNVTNSSVTSCSVNSLLANLLPKMSLKVTILPDSKTMQTMDIGNIDDSGSQDNFHHEEHIKMETGGVPPSKNVLYVYKIIHIYPTMLDFPPFVGFNV